MGKLVVVGIDVGYGFVKTAKTAFTTSLRDHKELKPTMMEHVIYYQGKYYALGNDRLKAGRTKVSDDNSYVLTLAAIAERLKTKNITDADICLSVGLPLERCNGVSSDILRKYYMRADEVSFEYEDISYTIRIAKVIVSPQGLAGVIDLISDKLLPDPCLIIDIGSWTVDVLPFENGAPQINKAFSLNDGVITCMNACNEEIRKRADGQEILESQIQQIMMNQPSSLDIFYVNICEEVIKKYVKNIADNLLERKFNLNTIPCFFLGGGSSVVKNFNTDDDKIFKLANFKPDICANAIGYELIAKSQLIKEGYSVDDFVILP